jgi:hypothetical protein
VLEIQSLCNYLQFIIGDAQVPLGVGDALMIEFMHNKRQIHSLYSGMVAPGLSKNVGTVVASQSDFMTDGYIVPLDRRG